MEPNHEPQLVSVVTKKSKPSSKPRNKKCLQRRRSKPNKPKNSTIVADEGHERVPHRGTSAVGEIYVLRVGRVAMRELARAQKRDAETRELITNLLQTMTAQMTQHQVIMQHMQEGRATPTRATEPAHFDLRVDLRLLVYSGRINESYELYYAGCVQFFQANGFRDLMMRIQEMSEIDRIQSFTRGLMTETKKEVLFDA
ncbi:hypothetical protein P43SY_008430 [Pythium insidiosum]|uniref:Uncharacterized protein n=1 Tax=Pythium insidiosum TaxID=114742 RepID=A0AAD5L841_PYTIN|nr:hypothetical protein P43SY_008430 [Pythium insidiosum]